MLTVVCTHLQPDYQNLVWIVSGLELVWSASTWSVDCKRMMTSSASRHFLAIEQHSWQILFRFCYSTVPMVLIYQNEMVRGELVGRLIFLEGTWVHHFSSKNAVSQLKEHQYVSVHQSQLKSQPCEFRKLYGIVKTEQNLLIPSSPLPESRKQAKTTCPCALCLHSAHNDNTL